MYKKVVSIVMGILLGAAVAALTVCAQEKLSMKEVYDFLKTREFVDLTQTFSPTTPVWEGFGQAVFEPAKDKETGEPYTLEKHGFKATVYTHVGQYGTHCDPPIHFCPGGMTLDKIPVKQMVLPLCVIDITAKLAAEPNYQCQVEDIEAWEAKHGRIPERAFVALRTDMYKDWITNPERFKRFPFPGWSMEAIKFLYEERHITANGHEAMDTDTLNCAVEDWLLRQGHWQIEVMANLDRVPESGALIVVSWPKPLDGDGFPARVFAIKP